jgi:pimeloyl-ACP methyl ester carboxylesterase
MAACVCVALALGGCISANMVAEKIATAPNRQDSQTDPLGKIAEPLYARRFKVSVGPPPATLAVAVIAPRNYGFAASEQWEKAPETLVLKWWIQGNADKGDGEKTTDRNAQALSGEKAARYMRKQLAQAMPELPVCQPTGTLVLLPGWGEAKDTLLGYALDFANHGYRVVLVDLRGQGESSGRYVTYGLIEHRDIGHVISALYAHHLVASKLALVGLSEGATVALDTAATDPRVDAVVAIAPFVNLRKAIRGVGRTFMPNLAKAVSDAKLSRALAIASNRVGMNLADADPSARVGGIKAPVFYVAGGKDSISPAADVKALAVKTPHADFLEIPRYPHIGLYFGVAKVGPPMLDALAKTMGPTQDAACLAKPPPEGVHYNLPFTLTLRKR